MAAAASSDEFELVVLCTGNRFRSPIAEAVLRERSHGLRFRVHSFGVLQLGSIPPLPEAVDLAAEFDLDISAHRARCLIGRDLSGADLVLGFEHDHVVKAIVETGAPRDRTFTLPELVGYVASLEPRQGVGTLDRARQAVAHAQAERVARRARAPEVPDPIGGTQEDFRRAAADVRELSERLADVLFD
jgi:protein-tyrosine phosphatase